MAKLSLLLAAPIALIGFAVPAAAEDDGERQTTIVKFGDLNLASVEGRARLTTRVRFAVQKVCDSRPNYRQDLQKRATAQRCVKTAMADADVKLAGLFNGGAARLADRGTIVIAAAP